MKKTEKRITISEYLARGQKSPDSCTVGKLKQLFKKHKLKDSTPVLFERIHDLYFTDHNWERITHINTFDFPGEGDDSEFVDEYIESSCGGILESQRDDSKALIIYGHI